MLEPSLLVNLAVALGYALAGGLVARQLRLPAIVGYLVAGVAIGPFTPGFVGDDVAIHQLAEFGVILLMFSVGLHFSFRDLWQVRHIAIPGALIETPVKVLLGYGLARAGGATPAAALVLGVAISVSSTVVLLRGLMDTGELDSRHGRVAVGWLVIEDLIAIVALVLLPAFGGPDGGDAWRAPTWAIARAGLFVALMLIVGPRIVPPLMSRVVKTRSRELFVLVALSAAIGTSMASAAFFGVSVALGAFLAGVVFGESEFKHQIAADLLPFREAFAVLFFVSVGMVVDPIHLAGTWRQVIGWSLLVVAGKWLVTMLGGFVVPTPARTTLVVASGLSQIGEFSFIVGQAALALGMISSDQYSLILAAAIVSISVNSIMLRLIEPIERRLKSRPALWRLFNRGPVREFEAPATITDHVVIVGCGRVGRHIAEALGRLGVARLVVESDPTRLDKLRALGVPTLFGDAGSSEILGQAHLSSARALVITVPDDAVAMAVAHAARTEAPALRIVARAATWEGARRLKTAGAAHVVRPELEGGVEIVRRTLLELDLPAADVQRYAELIRREGLDEAERVSDDVERLLADLRQSGGEVEIVWVDVPAQSPVDGLTIEEAAVRSRTGASVVAASRDRIATSNPGPEFRMGAGDRLAVIGTATQVNAVMALLAQPTPGGTAASAT